MPPFRWTLVDDEGQELRSSEDFSTKEEAEAWMSAHWAELLEEGAGSVRLSDADVVLYDMGLREG